MNPRVLVATAAVAGLFTLSGCGLLTPSETAQEPPTAGSPVAATPAPTTAAPTPSPTATSEGSTGTGSVGNGGLPDPCTLLSEAEVVSLTGREIVQIDRDGAGPDDNHRYCQWQQSAGRLGLFVNRVVGTEYDVRPPQAEPVDGIGDEAYLLAGHLFVRDGSIMFDIYARGGSEAENLAEARKVVEVLIPRI